MQSLNSFRESSLAIMLSSKAALKGYATERFTFALAGLGQVSLESVAP